MRRRRVRPEVLKHLEASIEDVDGNERVAFFASDVFLRLNGWRLAVEADAARAFLIGLLERGECNFENLLEWLRESLQPLPG